MPRSKSKPRKKRLLIVSVTELKYQPKRALRALKLGKTVFISRWDRAGLVLDGKDLSWLPHIPLSRILRSDIRYYDSGSVISKGQVVARIRRPTSAEKLSVSN